MTTRLKVVEYFKEDFDLRDKKAVERFLKNTYWTVFTTNPKVMDFWSRKAYSIVSSGVSLREKLQNDPNFGHYLLGSVVGMVFACSVLDFDKIVKRFNAGLEGDLNLNESCNAECVKDIINRCNIAWGALYHELKLHMIVTLSVVADVYDRIDILDGYGQGVFFLIVHFGGDRLEEVVKNGINEVRQNLRIIIE